MAGGSAQDEIDCGHYVVPPDRFRMVADVPQVAGVPGVGYAESASPSEVEVPSRKARELLQPYEHLQHEHGDQALAAAAAVLPSV